MKVPLLVWPHCFNPFLRWLLKPILRPVCRNLVHGTQPKITGMGYSEEGIVIQEIDWMGIVGYKTLSWECADTLVVVLDHFRDKRAEAIK